MKIEICEFSFQTWSVLPLGHEFQGRKKRHIFESALFPRYSADTNISRIGRSLLSISKFECHENYVLGKVVNTDLKCAILN